MKKNKGFTLTEILLAVMIVGIIGVALASLTTAASREGGIGRSKVMLRNNLSLAIRQLRTDVQGATRVLYVRGRIGSKPSGEEPLLLLAKGEDVNGEALPGGATYVSYCFKPGLISSGVLPSGAWRGGQIQRYETSSRPGSETSICRGSSTTILHNVKFIPPIGSVDSDNYYPVPFFYLPGRPNDKYDLLSLNSTSSVNKQYLYSDLGSVLVVKIITELNSTPVVNDVIDETFVLPNGFQVTKINDR